MYMHYLMFDNFYLNEYMHECMKKYMNEIWGKNEFILGYP